MIVLAHLCALARETLTLAQMQKIERDIPIVLYGTAYWKEINNFEALVRYGAIDADDLSLFSFADTPAEAFELLRSKLPLGSEATSPAFEKSQTPTTGDAR